MTDKGKGRQMPARPGRRAMALKQVRRRKMRDRAKACK